MSDYGTLTAEICGTNLITSVAGSNGTSLSWVQSDTIELQGATPTIIANAQRRLNRDISSQLLLVSNTTTMTIGNTTLARPGGAGASGQPQVASLAMLRYTNNSAALVPLLFRPLGYLMQWPTGAGAYGPPKYYGVQDVDNYAVRPQPDAAYSYTILYKQFVPTLTSAANTNIMTTYFYRALQAACFADALRFMQGVGDQSDQQLVAVWEAAYAQEVAAINATELRELRDDTQLPGVLAENTIPVGGGQR